jgi:hypothetical protein
MSERSTTERYLDEASQATYHTERGFQAIGGGRVTVRDIYHSLYTLMCNQTSRELLF